MKNLNELCEGLLDADYDVKFNAFQQYLLHHVDPCKAADMLNLKWNDDKKFDVVMGILAHLDTYPTISSAEAKRRIKAGDQNVVGLRDAQGVFMDIKDIYLFNHDKSIWQHYLSEQSRHLHIIAYMNHEEKWRSSIELSGAPCKSVIRGIDKFYDCSA